MAGVYVDTSALARVMLDEPDAGTVLGALEAFDETVSSRLLEVELRRVGLRERLAQSAVEEWLAGVALVPVDEGVLADAGRVAPALVATLDAIHLGTALALAQVGAIDTLMTFDARLAEGARAHGLAVVAPTCAVEPQDQSE